MVHILLLILKIIGILLLILLGLVLGAILLVLLVPVRYRVEGAKRPDIQGRLQITWLLHLISVAAEYQNGISIQIKLLGFSVFPRKEKENSQKLTGESERTAKPEKSDKSKKSKVEKSEKAAEREELERAEPSVRTEKADESEGTIKLEKAVELDNTAAPKTMTEPEHSAESEKAVKLEKSSEPEIRLTEEMSSEEASLEMSPSKKKRLNLRLTFLTWIQSIEQKIRGIWDKIRVGLQTAAVQWEQKKALAKKGYAFVTAPENQATFRLILRQGKRMLKHCLPRKISGAMTVGFEEPALLGNVLAAIAIFYPVYKNQLQVTPVFGQNVLEGEFSFRGYIRPGTLLVLAVRLLFDKNLRTLIKKFLRR